jgi:hypothetical protein
VQPPAKAASLRAAVHALLAGQRGGALSGRGRGDCSGDDVDDDSDGDGGGDGAYDGAGGRLGQQQHAVDMLVSGAGVAPGAAVVRFGGRYLAAAARVLAAPASAPRE